MNARRRSTSLRVARACAPPALSGIIALSFAVLGGSGQAAASDSSSPSGSGSVSSLQTQAQELAGQIQADNQTLDQLDESYDAGQIAYAQLQSRQATLRVQIAASAVQVAAARQTLKEEAILAYLTGGAPIIQRPASLGDNADLTLAYASIVAGGEKANVARYQATLATQAGEQAAMQATVRDEAFTLSDIAGVRSQAASTLASQQAALAQVKGQLALAVAAVQSREQAAEQAVIQSQMQAPSSAPAGGGPSGTAAVTPTTVVVATTARSASQAPATTDGPRPTSAPSSPSTTAPPSSPPPSGGSSGSGSIPAQAPGVNAVLAYARAQLGKPYQWGGAGPDSFDCSGLVMMAWEQAGIYFPHLAQDQYDLTARIPLSAMVPGDLVFYGTPDDVYHVGIYVGNGNMIDAPETGQNVSIQNIYWSGLLGAGRVTTSS